MITIQTDDTKRAATKSALQLKEIKNIEEADTKQGLYSDRIAKPCPPELPTFSGTPSEDFIVFKDEFQTAVTDNKVSKSDQLGKLRKALGFIWIQFS